MLCVNGCSHRAYAASPDDNSLFFQRIECMMPTYRVRHASWILAILLAGFVAGSAVARADTAPLAPELAPPPGATVVREVQAGGVQVYGCRLTPGGTLAWLLNGPKAILVNADGTDFGTHSAGPRWTSTDGSSIAADGAHPLAKSDRPGSVAELVLAVTESSGNGILSPVRFVRRWDTAGGLPPADGCDASHINASAARHYSAIYTFFR